MKKSLPKSKNLARQLSEYAASAVALMSIGSVTDAQVSYSGPQDLQIHMPDGYLEIDMDGDMVNDFAVQLYSFSVNGSQGAYYYRYAMDFAVMQNLRTGSYNNSWMTRLSTINSATSNIQREPVVDGLEFGELVDPENDNWAGPSTAAISGALAAEIVYSVDGPFYSIYYSLNAGDFLNKELYAGVRFYIGTDRHYGWIRLSLGEEIEPATIIDWAYNQTPETAVQAGDGLGEDLPPVLSLSGAYGPSNEALRTISMTATEEIEGFELSDIQITNGNASDFVELTQGLIYTVDITATGEGEVIFEIPANAFSDTASNGNPAMKAQWILDQTEPQAEFVPVAPYTNSYLFFVTLNFSEEIEGLETGDLVLSNCQVSQISDMDNSREFQLDVISVNEGPAGIQLPAGSVTDQVGQDNESSVSINWIYDVTGPDADMTNNIDGETYDSVVTVNVSFDEQILNLSRYDFDMDNASVLSLTKISDTEYELEASALEFGDVKVELPFGAAQDRAGNSSSSSQLSWKYLNPVNLNNQEEEGITIYPNPAGRMIHIELTEESEIQLFDLKGNMLLHSERVIAETLDIRGFQPGIYILRISGASKTTSRKVIID
jgi:hypothetical protein